MDNDGQGPAARHPPQVRAETADDHLLLALSGSWVTQTIGGIDAEMRKHESAIGDKPVTVDLSDVTISIRRARGWSIVLCVRPRRPGARRR